MNDNNFKKKSLYDNVYFTLRDIWANTHSTDIIYQVNWWNDYLAGGISFEERTNDFQYTNILHKRDLVERLKKWLKTITIYDFEFQEPDEDESINMNNHMNFDDWWIQFEEFRHLIDEQYEKYCMLEENKAEDEHQ